MKFSYLPLKKIFIYILVVFVSVAYSYETIVYLSKAIQNEAIVCCGGDIDCCENSQESKNNENKDDKKEFKEYIYFKGMGTSPTLFINYVWLNYKNLYPANDYSQSVYFPPEVV